jgi:hypothetical protein
VYLSIVSLLSINFSVFLESDFRERLVQILRKALSRRQDVYPLHDNAGHYRFFFFDRRISRLLLAIEDHINVDDEIIPGTRHSAHYPSGI